MEDKKDITNCIYIYDKTVNLRTYFSIESRHEMFKEEYVKIEFFYSEGYFVLSIPTIDRKGKIYKTVKRSHKSRNLRGFDVSGIDLQTTGTFKIDQEDSTEDELVVYIK